MAWTAITRPPTPSDTSLENYGGWTRVYTNPYLGAGGSIMVSKEGRRCEGMRTGSQYRYTASGSPTGDQAVRADIRLNPASAEEGFQLLTRMGASSGGYQATWEPAVNNISLYRRITATSYSLLTSLSTTLAQGSIVTQAFLKVTGTGSVCTVVVGDATRGSCLTFADSTSPQTTGLPGIGWNAVSGVFGSASVAWLTNLKIEDWSSGAAVTVKSEDFNLGGWTTIARPS